MILLQLFLTFLKIGLFTIGGGYAMIPMMRDEIVLNYAWITEEQFVNFIGIAESTPGPFAINIATFVGYSQYGFLGAFCSTFGVVFPSFLIILVIAKLFVKFSENKIVKSVFWGFKPVVAGLITSAAFTLTLSAIFPNISFETLTFDFSGFEIFSFVIFAIIFVLSMIKFKGKKLHPFVLIFGSAALGVVFFGVVPQFL